MNPNDLMKLSKKGLDVRLPLLECFPTQFKNYSITLHIPEYTSICPKTGLPDFATIKISYNPNKTCLELKSLKYYVVFYRDIGIFHEHWVNKILDDIILSCKPRWAKVEGIVNSRGGIQTTVVAEYPRTL